MDQSCSTIKSTIPYVFPHRMNHKRKQQNGQKAQNKVYMTTKKKNQPQKMTKIKRSSFIPRTTSSTWITHRCTRTVSHYVEHSQSTTITTLTDQSRQIPTPAIVAGPYNSSCHIFKPYFSEHLAEHSWQTQPPPRFSVIPHIDPLVPIYQYH